MGWEQPVVANQIHLPTQRHRLARQASAQAARHLCQDRAGEEHPGMRAVSPVSACRMARPSSSVVAPQMPKPVQRLVSSAGAVSTGHRLHTRLAVSIWGLVLSGRRRVLGWSAGGVGLQAAVKAHRLRDPWNPTHPARQPETRNGHRPLSR